MQNIDDLLLPFDFDFNDQLEEIHETKAELKATKETLETTIEELTEVKATLKATKEELAKTKKRVEVLEQNDELLLRTLEVFIANKRQRNI
jgi:prefoldin subunit 5